jgi:uncharacterized RDD family membrane protein YckC
MVVFWTLAGQTPGMNFFGIRIGQPGTRLSLRQSIRRLAGFALSVVTFGIGFLGVLFDERRRGWPDRLAETEVLYEPDERRPAPWSVLETAKAPDVRGLRPHQQVGGEAPLRG